MSDEEAAKEYALNLLGGAPGKQGDREDIVKAFLAGFQRGKESSEAYIDPNCTWACMCGKRSKNHENALDEVLKAAEQHLKDIGEPSPYAPVFDLEKIKEIITTLRKDRK